MTTIRQRLTDALLAAHTKDPLADFDVFAGETIAYWDDIADVLLSLPGIAIIDITRIDPIAEAIAKNWPDTYAKSWPWTDIPEHDREKYRTMARDALLAAAKALTQ